MDWARGNTPDPPVLAHLAECSACAQFLEEQRALGGAMGRLAKEPLPPAQQFEARVMAGFDKVRPARRPVLRWVLGGALAASVLLGALLTNRSVPPAAPIADEAGFIPIPYTIPLSAQEPFTVWRMEIPVARLRAVGYRVPAPDPAAIVEADVLVSQDGRARAVRPISISVLN